MARIRTIKPEFWKHEALSELPEATHILAAALLNYADDHGYFNANPKLIIAEYSPLREPSVSVPESLRSLQTIGYIRIGSTPDGRRYGLITEFAKHQKVSHPTDSKIQALPITWDDSVNPSEKFRSPPETFRPEQGTGNREQGMEKTPPLRGVAVPSKPIFVLPDWVPEEPWAAFAEMRKKARAPLTALASDLVVKELQKLRAKGDDPTAVLNQSTLNAWRDVYPLKDKTNGRTGKASRIDNAIEGARAFLGTPEPDSGGVAARSTQSAVSGQRGAISGPSIADPGDDHEGISGAGNAPAGSSRVRLAADGLSDAAAPVRGIFCGSETPDASGIEDGDGSLQALTRQRVFS